MASQQNLDPYLVKCIGFLYDSKNLRKGDQPPLQKMLEEALYEECGVKKDYTDFFQSQLPPKEITTNEASASSAMVSTNDENIAPSPASDIFDYTEYLNKEELDQDLRNLIVDDLLCTKCLQMNVSENNRLLECLECRCLYHQQCHQPPVIKYIETWVCTDCQKLKMRKHLDRAKNKALQEKQAQANAKSGSPYNSQSGHGSAPYQLSNTKGSRYGPSCSYYSSPSFSAACSSSSGFTGPSRPPEANSSSSSSPRIRPSPIETLGLQKSSSTAQKSKKSSSTKHSSPVRPPTGSKSKSKKKKLR